MTMTLVATPDPDDGDELARWSDEDGPANDDWIHEAYLRQHPLVEYREPWL